MDTQTAEKLARLTAALRALAADYRRTAELTEGWIAASRPRAHATLIQVGQTAAERRAAANIDALLADAE